MRHWLAGGLSPICRLAAVTDCKAWCSHVRDDSERISTSGPRNLRIVASQLFATTTRLPLRSIAATVSQHDELEEELSTLRGGLKNFFEQSDEFRIWRDCNTGEYFVEKVDISAHGPSRLKSDSPVSHFWKSFDYGLVLPFIPSFFVPWTIIFARLPQQLQEAMPKEQRSRNLVTLMINHCDFYLGLDLLVRRSKEIQPDDAADSLYRDWAVSPQAVERLAAAFRGPVQSSEIRDKVEAAVFTEAVGLLSLSSLCRLFPTLIGRYTLRGKNLFESFFGVDNNTEASHNNDSEECDPIVSKALVAAFMRSPVRAAVSDLIAAVGEDVQLALAKTGIKRYLCRNGPLRMDRYGFVSCGPRSTSNPTAETIRSFLGVLVPLEPSPRDEVNKFRQIDTFKRWRRSKERIKERQANSIFRDDKMLLAHLLSVVSDTEYMPFEAVSVKMDPQARCWLPEGSLLKFVNNHRRMFDLRQTFAASTTYHVRRLKPGERITPEKQVFSEDDVMSFVLNSLKGPGWSLSSLWAKLPLLVREQLGDVASFRMFLERTNMFDIVSTASSAIVTLRSPPEAEAEVMEAAGTANQEETKRPINIDNDDHR
jgi:hypothetical protein